MARWLLQTVPPWINLLVGHAEFRIKMGIQDQIDEVSALANLSGNRQLLIELAQIFCEDLPSLLCRLRTALEQHDLVLIRSVVPSLKNLAATFFANEIVLLANKLELAATAGGFDTLVKNIPQLENLLIDLHSEICSKGWWDGEKICDPNRIS